MMPPDALALITARAGSKRVPGKNAKMLGGKPLAAWTFEAALAARRVGRVLLSTDDAALGEMAKAAGIAVLERPAELASDHATSVDVALHALNHERDAGRDWGTLCLLQPTSPFRAAGRIDEGLAKLANTPGANAIVGAVTPAHHPLHCLTQDKDGHLEPVASPVNSANPVRSQDLPPAWALTGSFYAIRSAALREYRTFLPPACLPLVCDAPGEAIDIDWPEDFARAQEHLRSLTGGPE
jgi:CMP-N-acetylneuraminic acid synthetase